MKTQSRRRFLQSVLGVSAASLFSNYYQLAGKEIGRHKISDIKVMMLQGPRTYTLIKVETDTGHFGIGEGYGNPGVGVKEQVLSLKPLVLGRDFHFFGDFVMGNGPAGHERVDRLYRDLLHLNSGGVDYL